MNHFCCELWLWVSMRESSIGANFEEKISRGRTVAHGGGRGGLNVLNGTITTCSLQNPKQNINNTEVSIQNKAWQGPFSSVPKATTLVTYSLEYIKQ